MANGKKKRSNKKLLIFGGLGGLLLVIILLVAFGGSKEQIVAVQIDKVVKRNITQIVTATGTINPDFQVKISAEATGEIVSLNVKEGDAVKKGQLLLKIKPETYIAQKNRAEASLRSVKASLNYYKASLNQAEITLKRVQALYDKKLASDSELETAKTQFESAQGGYDAQKASVEQAEAGLNEAKENLYKTTVYAPMNGVVTSLKVELGERVLGSGYSSGSELLTVSDLSIMEATVDVDENDVVFVALGDTARIKIDAFSGKSFNGVVTEIGNSAKSTGTTSQDQVVNYAVKIKIVDKESTIRPGMSCDARIETETKKDVWAVPIQSVTARGETTSIPAPPSNNNQVQVTDNRIKTNKATVKPKEIVFVVNNNQVKVVDVKTGISDDSYIEIESGLSGNEQVVSGPYKAISKELENGSKIMIQSGKGTGETKK
jgi:HlyD family secretion protein